MANAMTAAEDRRLAIQSRLDAAKDQSERNRMGQFATPTELAQAILEYAQTQMDARAAVRFMDPAIGTGSFFSALRAVFPAERVQRAVGYEVDPHYGEPATRLWKGTALEVRLEDFTRADPPSDRERCNLLICNPPYVRHHHIDKKEKQRLQARTRQACGIQLNGLAGLYCYFLGLAHPWLATGGLAGWLLPSEFMDVNYGAAVKRYLLSQVTLLHIHRFDPDEGQFGDALVSSAMVWFSQGKPPRRHQVRMTYGGSLLRPRRERRVPVDTLRRAPKWTQYPMRKSRSEARVPTLADFFAIKRGLVTGSNGYFILSPEEIEERGLPVEVFRPILPGPRYLPANEILADSVGNPVLECPLFLLDCRWPEAEIREQYPILGTYLEAGKAQGIAERYVCRHRSPWYAQERRPATPFLCTYLGRSHSERACPFRFILNHSRATAPNVYLMLYPKGFLERAVAASVSLKRQIWDCLNDIGSEEILSEGRVYGGGLHKLEPKELGRVSAAALAERLPEPERWNAPQQLKMF